MCTVFTSANKDNSSIFVGKNYDMTAPCYGLVYVNRPNLKKTALLKPPENPAQWESKYGSVTVNQVGKEFPSSGMNEKGLVVEQTTLWNTLYPDPDKRPAIKELQWIQYMLDTCATTEEVIEQSHKVRIAQELSKIQFFICDSGGHSCLIEYILGDPIILKGDGLPYPVITNDMYETSIGYLNIHENYGGKKAITNTDMSVDRFVVTIDALKNHPNENNLSIEDIYEILQLTSWKLTEWQVVSDPAHKVMAYRTRTCPEIRKIDLTQIDFPGITSALYREMDENTTELKSYSPERNYQIVKGFFLENKHFGHLKVPEKDLLALADYVNAI